MTLSPARISGNPAARQWIVRRIVYGDTIAALDELFCEAKAEYIPLKGAHLICTGLADRMRERGMIDIDLLVRPTEYERIKRFLGSRPGIKSEPPDPWPFEQAFILARGGHGVRFELHRALNRPERFLLDVERLFSRSGPQTRFRRIMTSEDALVVLLCHTLVHLVDGIRSQVFDEIGLLAGQKGFSWEHFFGALRETGIERFGRALLLRAARAGKLQLPVNLEDSGWAAALLGIRTPGRGRGVLTLLFRCCIESVFVRDPAALFLRHAFRFLRPDRH